MQILLQKRGILKRRESRCGERWRIKRAGSLLPDTNVILRYLLQDDLQQFAEIEASIEAVRTGADQATILESVVVECLYVLTKGYKVSKDKAAGALIGLLQYKGIVNSDRIPLIEGLTLFIEQQLDPVDCIVLAKSNADDLRPLTFDKDLKRVASEIENR